jgi:4-amino-4-deoxy-L-arabinose transferase-like glycosyltransferase
LKQAAVALFVLASTSALVWSWAAVERRLAAGFTLDLQAADGQSRTARVFDLEPVRALRLAPSRPAVAAWSTWLATREGTFDVVVAARSPTTVSIDGAAVLEHDGRPRRLTTPARVSAGWHRVVVEHQLGDEDADLRVALGAFGGDAPRLDQMAVFVTPPSSVLAAIRPWAGAAAIASLLGLAPALLAQWRAASRERRAHLRRLGVHAAAGLVSVYAGALRLEALASKYDAPSWMSRLVPLVRPLHPRGMRWLPPEHPWEGDPFSYLRLARDMRWFYEASVREPVFVAATKVSLAATGGADAAVGLTSGVFSTLLVPAVYVLGVVAFSPAVGLAAAIAMAIERQAIGIGVDGWRDDAFAAFVVLSAAALLRLEERPTRRRAVLTGVVMAAAILTRITSLSFLLPALVLPLLVRDVGAPSRRRAFAVAAAVSGALVLPFLVSCAITYGDPLYSINAHTRFYRSRAAGGPEAATTWHSFLVEGRGPAAILDTALVGLTSYPFTNKWEHFDVWGEWLGPVLAFLALLGLVLWMAVSRGRRLLVVLFSSLVPYAFTWEIPGGSEWRFTLHAYPFYLLAAASAPTIAAHLLPGLRAAWRERRPAMLARAAAAAATAGVLYAGAGGLAYARVREDVRAGHATRIVAGLRDVWFFGSGWSWPKGAGHVFVREASAEGAEMHVPLSAGVRHLVLRLDPVGDHADATLTLNDIPLGTLALTRDPDRIGRYELDVPPGVPRDGNNTLRLRATAPVRLWLVSVEPLSTTTIAR